jgi:hypothetical protein
MAFTGYCGLTYGGFTPYPYRSATAALILLKKLWSSFQPAPRPWRGQANQSQIGTV